MSTPTDAEPKGIGSLNELNLKGSGGFASASPLGMSCRKGS